MVWSQDLADEDFDVASDVIKAKFMVDGANS